MTETEIEIKNKILEIFNLKRDKPNTRFDESHFLDYLTYPAKEKGQIKNSFVGVRKFHRFLDCVELEFGICFTLSDLDNPYYSIDNLTKKVQERLNKRTGNIIIIKQRIAQKDNFYIEFILLSILISLYIFLKLHLIPIAFTILFGIFFYWITISKLSNNRHNKNLYEVIMNKNS